MPAFQYLGTAAKVSHSWDIVCTTHHPVQSSPEHKSGNSTSPACSQHHTSLRLLLRSTQDTALLMEGRMVPPADPLHQQSRIQAAAIGGIHLGTGRQLGKVHIDRRSPKRMRWMLGLKRLCKLQWRGQCRVPIDYRLGSSKTLLLIPVAF